MISACQFRFSRVLTVIERATFVTGPDAATLLAGPWRTGDQDRVAARGRFLSLLRAPCALSKSCQGKANPPPLLGEHSGKILSELGFREETIRIFSREELPGWCPKQRCR